MKISAMTINKFRSIYNCKIDLKNITAIVGENNSGKTAMLRALNAFFNFKEEEKYFIDDTHKYGPRANTRIEIVFQEIKHKHIYSGKIDNNMLTIGMKYKFSTHRKSLYFKKDGHEIACDEDLINEIKNDINYIYIPVSRGNLDLQWNENSVFNKLILEFAKKYTKSRDTVSKHVSSAAGKLHSSILSKIEDRLEEFYPSDGDYSFTIDYKNNIDYQILLDNLVLKMKENNKLYPIQEYGSGIKSLVVISILRMLSSLNSVDTIFAIEEPEINLHPQMQKHFILFMKESMSEQKSSNEVQLLIATHSPVIIDELNHSDIILVRREKDENRGFYSIVTQLNDNFWNRDFEEFKYYQFFDFKNSDFFFSKYVIITESKTDSQVIRKLLIDGLGWKMSYVSIIELNGVASLQYPYFLLKKLEIPFSVIVDKDFFVQYKNDELEKSRDSISGFPIYKNSLNNTKVINDLFKTTAEKTNVINSINNESYSKMCNLLKNYRFYTMKFCLEMDIVSSSMACKEFYNILNIPLEKQSSKYLLTDYKKSIKKIENISKVLNNIQQRDYPISFKKMRKGILEDISKYI